MNYFLIFVLCIVSVTARASNVPEGDRVNGENGWYIPQTNGSLVWMDLEEAESYLNHAERLSTNPVTFLLYTSANPNNGHKITASSKSIENSPFNPKNPTRITIHGWNAGRNDYVNWGIRKAFLSHGNHNIITVDWNRGRSVDYASSVLAISGVGKKVANLIDFLITKHGLQLRDVEIIGHSLGAHVAGFSGKYVKSGQVHAIIGLDPALPLYHYNKPSKRLSHTDAHYVETIQTNGGQLGFLKPIGKGSFYPNGGKSQPGCGIDLIGSCAHSRSIIYYVEAIERDNFASVECDSYNSAIAKNCGTTYSSVRMASSSNPFTAEGVFYVPVNKGSPYGKLE
uniref:Putative phospholipase a1-like protein n=1 Tax=Haematobia irritans TaxID=7368 RepID=A0A1L8EHW9_HAEIR